jgi:hypothetical protein
MRSTCCLLSVLLLAAFVGPVYGADAKSPEAGNWKITLTPHPKNTLEHTDKPFDDVLTLKDSKLSSKVCDGYKFAAAPYAARMVDGKAGMASDLKSPEHGAATWVIKECKDEKISGTFSWDKAGKKAVFDFAGTREK